MAPSSSLEQAVDVVGPPIGLGSDLPWFLFILGTHPASLFSDTILLSVPLIK